MKCNFIVGQKVICLDYTINPKWWPRGETLPEPGKMYVIREVGVDPWGEGNPVIWLKEIINPVLTYSHNGISHTNETGFAARNFKPLIETDISIFTNMLKEKPREKVLTMAGRDRAMQRGKYSV